MGINLRAAYYILFLISMVAKHGSTNLTTTTGAVAYKENIVDILEMRIFAINSGAR